MDRIILLRRSDRYSQRNNPYKPYAACMPTTFVMWCIASRIDIESKIPQGLAADDHCMRMLNTNEAMLFAQKKYPDLMRAGYFPNEIHGMYHSYLEPLIFGKTLSDFIYADEKTESGLTFAEYKSIIELGHPIWTSGAYDGAKGPIEGHANLFCGINGENLLNVDPYGNFHTNYTDDSGYGIEYTEQEFNEHIKPLGSKRKNAHILRGIK